MSETREKLPKDVYAPLVSGKDKQTISGKKLKDMERSERRAKLLEEKAKLDKSSGKTQSVLNALHNAQVPKSGRGKPYGDDKESIKQKQKAIDKALETYKKGGSVSRGDGCAKRGKTKGRMY